MRIQSEQQLDPYSYIISLNIQKNTDEIEIWQF
jgi:hypothetical protein